MDRMDERKAIAAELDGHAEAWRTVNDRPEVQEARAKSDEADRVAREANREFRKVFDRFAPRDDVRAQRLAKDHPGLVLAGDDYPWVCRCAVSGLPIFEGDKVFIGGEDEHDRTYILADVIQLTPAFAHLTPAIAKAREIEEEDQDDLEDEEEAA